MFFTRTEFNQIQTATVVNRNKRLVILLREAIKQFRIPINKLITNKGTQKCLK